MTVNRDQLIKLLNLTRSEYDAEALNAIRPGQGAPQPGPGSGRACHRWGRPIANCRFSRRRLVNTTLSYSQTYKT
jgi:hypothetical protein